MSFLCRAPWTSVAFQPTGVGPCCVYEFQPGHDNSFADIKQQFLNNEIPAGCNKCKQAFDSNQSAYYKSFDQYQTDFKENNIQEINVKSNNFCNLSCRSCGPHFSSKWELEFNKHMVITKDYGVLEKLNQLDFSKLKKIVFAGGEPTLTDEHLYVLNHLIDSNQTQIDIRLSTNALVLEYKNIDLIDIWKKFPNLKLQLSVDAIGDRAASIRSGTNWNVLEKNLQIIKNSNIKHYVNITVSALNIWFLNETVDYLKNKLQVKNLNYNLLYNPDILNIQVIPKKYSNIINHVIDHCIQLDNQFHQLEEIRQYFNAGCTEYLWPHFLIYNLMLDVNRKENLFDHLPIKQDLVDTWLKL